MNHTHMMENFPTLNIENINISNFESKQKDTKIKLNLSIGPAKRMIAEYFAENLSSIYLYIYLVKESEEKQVSRLLYSSEKKAFMKSIDNRSTGSIRKNQKGFTKISLLSLLKNSKENMTYEGSEKLYKCFFEVEVDYLNYENQNSSLTRNSKNRNPSGVSLFCFLESSLDSNSTLPGTNIAYENILKYDKSKKKLYLPNQRSVYVIDDVQSKVNGSLYSGPVHYHSRSRPRPDGTSGWMTGKTHTNGSFNLKTVEVSNNKIFSKQQIEKELEYSAKLPDNTLYNIKNTGADLKNATKSYTDPFKSTRGQNKYENVRNSMLATAHAGKNFLTKETSDSSHYRVFRRGNRDILNTSYCGCTIGLDIYFLLKSNSSASSIIDFHNRRKNHAILSSIVSLTSIDHLRITRRRVADDLLPNNETSNKIRGKYHNQNDFEILIESMDAGQRRIQRRRNAKAEIEEIDLVDMRTGKKKAGVRTLFVRDYDLFHNKDFGTYTYDLEVVITDGILGYLKRLNNKINQSVRKYEKYLLSLETKPSTASNSGMQTVSESVSAYRECREFLTGEKFNTKNLIQQLRPSRKNMEITQIFYTHLKKTKLLLNNYVEKFSLSKRTKERKNESKNFSSSPKFPGVLNLSVKTNVYHNTSDLMKLCTDPGLESVGSQEIPKLSVFAEQLLKNASNNSLSMQQSFKPGRFVNIQKSKYIIESNSFFKKRDQTKSGISPHPGIKKQNFKIGEIEEVMNLQDYNSSGEESKNNFNVKIATLKKSKEDSLVIKNKPHEYYFKYLQSSLSGISLTTTKFSSKAKPFGDDFGFKQVLANLIPDMSQEEQTAIVDSIYEIKDRKKFEEYIENNFKEIISVKQSLGSLYSLFNGFLSFNQKMIMENNKVNYEELFNSGTNQNPDLELERQNYSNVFDMERFYAYFNSLGGEKVFLTTEMLNVLSKNEKTSSGFIFLKFENNKQNNLPLINNGILLRI